MYDRILLPTDGSAGVDTAIEHAIDAAERYDATLHVLYVVDSTTYEAYSGDEYVHEREGLEQGLRQLGEDAIETITTRAATNGIPTESAIENGDPHEQILRYADREDVDLIVLGSRNRTGEYRRLLGSVTERVSRMAPQTVTIVKSPLAD
ncbi:MAG: universal stress protein [Halobacteriota archaeon]